MGFFNLSAVAFSIAVALAKAIAKVEIGEDPYDPREIG